MNGKSKRHITTIAGCALSFALLTACGSGGGGNGSSGPDDGSLEPVPQPGFASCFDISLDAAACDPATASFTLGSTNPYYPLIVGSLTVLEGEEDGELLRVERRVLAETEEIAGVTVRVLDHRSYIDGEIHEIARNFYVEATDGTVCYFGEDVEFYEDGELVGEEGTWRAGENGAKPGIIMPAQPAVGQSYYQELADGRALDMGRVDRIGETATFAGQTYTDVLTIQDSNPIDDEEACVEEEKRYVPGIGEVVDETLELLDYSAIARCDEPTLDLAACDPGSASFTLASTNPYYPLVVGSISVLEGEDDDERVRIERTVLADTEVVAGVETHVLEHREFVDDELVEIARNFYVEATDGTVCYFGEDVENFEDGELADTDGSWRAGVDGARAGIIMPAAPAVGQAYYQELDLGRAQDMGRVSEVGGSATVNDVTYPDVVTILDSNPLESCVEDEETKLFAAGVGEISDDGVDLISFTPGAP